MLLLKLRQQRPGAANRPLSDGDKSLKQRTIDEICLDLAVATRGVDQVGNGRKAVKLMPSGMATACQPPSLANAPLYLKGQNRQQPDNAPAQGTVLWALLRAAMPRPHR